MDVWNLQVKGKKTFIIKEKINLKVWNKEVFGRLDLKIENIVADLNELDVAEFAI